MSGPQPLLHRLKRKARRERKPTYTTIKANGKHRVGRTRKKGSINIFLHVPFFLTLITSRYGHFGDLPFLFE